MNPLLITEICAEQSDLLNALILLEEYIFEEKPEVLTAFDTLISSCQQAIVLEQEHDPLVQVEQFLDHFFVTQLFIDNAQQSWPIKSYRLVHALHYRRVAPVLKVILLQHIARLCGLNCDVVFIPESLMMRIICTDDYIVIFDVVTGEALDWQNFDNRIAELEGDPESLEILGESNKTLLRNYLTSLKNALIAENQYREALRCVDILLAMKPNDPIERRDRGFLLHQLDCFKVAYDDYRYFVEQCPNDPAAQLLKLQLDNIKIGNIVLH